MFKLFLAATFVTIVSCGWTDDFMGIFKPRATKSEESQGNSRVVGGQTATEPYPYQISMQMKKKENSSSSGGIFGFLTRSNKTWRSELCKNFNFYLKIEFLQSFLRRKRVECWSHCHSSSLVNLKHQGLSFLKTNPEYFLNFL